MMPKKTMKVAIEPEQFGTIWNLLLGALEDGNLTEYQAMAVEKLASEMNQATLKQNAG